jgi:hypothetical protein
MRYGKRPRKLKEKNQSKQTIEKMSPQGVDNVLTTYPMQNKGKPLSMGLVQVAYFLSIGFNFKINKLAPSKEIII